MTTATSDLGDPMSRPEVTAFVHAATSTVSYVVRDPRSDAAAVIDPAADWDPATGQVGHRAADEIVAFLRARGARLDWVIETHVHADHVSAAPHLKKRLGGRIAIGERIVRVRELLAGSEWAPEGGDRPLEGFDHLFADGETYRIGGLEAVALATPGHTPACMTHVVGDAAFVGDTVFMPDCGTARTDFPGGDARTLHRSIRRIFALPPTTRLFVCHDYPPGDRPFRWQTSIAEQRAANIHVHDGIGEDDFVALRRTRDATLAPPKLIGPSLRANLRGGG